MKQARNFNLPAMVLLCGVLLLCSFCATYAQSLTNAAAEQQELQLSLQHLSFQSVQRMLRDENAPVSYRGELRYNEKRETQMQLQPQHKLKKREASLAVALLNLTGQGLQTYDSSTNYQGKWELVTSLDISNNQLSSLKLAKFTLLQTLDARNNSLTIPPELSSTLVSLDLASNRLTQLSSSFFGQRMPLLTRLNLAHNHLSNISRRAFYNMISLQTLLLSHNNITDIDYETFLALPNLQHLDLSHNQLSGSAIRSLQGIPDLVSLSIAHNPQVGAAMQEFVASWSLKELDASSTGLCQVPAALAQSVRTLKLSHNWLKAINCGDLDSYPLLQYLDLSHSHVAHVEDDALGRLELLELLFLDHNSLMRVPNSLPTSLEHLFLQHNSILELQPQTFAGLKSLKTLDLSGNRLLYLPALPLPKLLTLNLQSAGIESVSQTIVHTLPQLRDLLLEDNPIKCSDLLGIAEWASPCRSPDLGQSLGRIDLKQRFLKMQSFNSQFAARKDDEPEAEVAESVLSSCGTTTMTTQQTMPKVQSPTVATATTTIAATQSIGNNMELLTTKTLGPAETTSLAKLQRQQMFGIPTASTKTETTITTTTTTTTTTIAATVANASQTASEAVGKARGVPSLYRAVAATTHADNSTNILATTPADSSSSTLPPTTTANISNFVAVATVAPAATPARKVNVPQTILALISSDVVARQQEKQERYDNTAVSSLLKMTATTPTATTPTTTIITTTTTTESISGQEAPMKPLHKHATLQLHIKDRHLIGTPLLMHKGDNLLVDAEQLLLPGTATIADAETLDGSQLRAEVTDKRQTEAIKSDAIATMETTLAAATTTITTPATAAAATATATAATAEKMHKKNPSLSIKKMTFSTKHHATSLITTAATTRTTTTAIAATTAATGKQPHQHNSVNTPNALGKQELSTFAELKAFVELKTEASKSAQLLDRRQETQPMLPSNHPGLMLLLACVLFIVLLAGLAHVYRCELPWQRTGRANGQTRPPHQRQLNEQDDVHSFLHYQGSVSANPAQLRAWHHSTRREAPYSSPLHNLQARELQREQQKLQFYSASLADSSKGSGSGSGCSSGSSRNSLHSPSHDDSYYIEMAPSSPIAPACVGMPNHLPMELLSSRSLTATHDSVAATELGGTVASVTTLRSVSSKLMAPSSRRLGIW